MSNYHFAETEWSHLSDNLFINLKASSVFTDLELLAEFKRRELDYSCIITNHESTPDAAPIFKTDGQLVIHDKTIFEKNIQGPSQVGYFYKSILYPAMEFLKNHPLLQEMELVTFDHIREQTFMSDTNITVITPQQLPDLKPNQVFVYMTLNGRTHPNPYEVEPFVKNKTKVIYNRKIGYRSFGSFEIV